MGLERHFNFCLCVHLKDHWARMRLSDTLKANGAVNLLEREGERDCRVY